MSLSIRLHSIHCVEEINESSASEETYALITVARLQPSPFPGVPATHNLRVTRFGVWEYFDKGDTVTGLGRPFWGLNSIPEDITDPANVIVAVTLMENDNGSPDSYRQLVETVATLSLTATLGEADRGVRATRLLQSIRAALDGVNLPIPFDLDDDHIGTDLLSLSGADLIPSGIREREMTIRSGEGHYKLTFQIARSAFDVFGAIEGKWAQLATGLGGATGPELPTFDGVGRAQSFQGGTVSWHPSIGANAVWGLIGARWLAIGREKFGFPITDELQTGDHQGRYNHFRAVHLPGRPESTIVWSPGTGAHEVYGAIRAKWASMGWTDGSLRYPLAPEQNHPGGRIQRFQGGSLFWNAQNGSVTVV